MVLRTYANTQRITRGIPSLFQAHTCGRHHGVSCGMQAPTWQEPDSPVTVRPPPQGPCALFTVALDRINSSLQRSCSCFCC